jgi:translation initiation factor 4E
MTEIANKKITALEDAENYNVKHPLQKSWTLWYDCPDKKANVKNWDEQLKNLVTFDTVEDFWG